MMCEKLNEDFDFVVFTFRSITKTSNNKIWNSSEWEILLAHKK